MFGFSVCDILQAWFCVYWKSSDLFVHLGACCKKCTAVFRTRQMLYLVQLGHRHPGANPVHVACCFTRGAGLNPSFKLF